MNSLADRHIRISYRSADRSRTNEKPRKNYQPPVLTVYGSLAELTGAVGNDSFDGVIGSRQTS